MKKAVVNLKITNRLVDIIGTSVTLVPLSLGISNLVNTNYNDNLINVAANLLASTMYISGATILGGLFYFRIRKNNRERKEEKKSSTNKVYIKI